MVKIYSYALLNKVYKCLSGQKNQGLFIVRFFVAAGCNNYYLPDERNLPGTKELEGPRHYVKDRSVKEIAETFPHPINKKEAAEYLLTSFDDNKVRSVMDEFGIPSDVPENNRAFAYAIVEQFNAYIESDKEDLENHIYAEFLKYSNLSEAETTIAAASHGSLVRGDNVYIAPYSKQSEHNVCCHEIFTHTWSLNNSGTTIWTGRKMVLVNQDKIKPRAKALEIPIPETRPNSTVQIQVEFDARGIEVTFNTVWEMQDAEGRNCFATIPYSFNFRINVHYNANNMEE